MWQLPSNLLEEDGEGQFEGGNDNGSDRVPAFRVNRKTVDSGPLDRNL